MATALNSVMAVRKLLTATRHKYSEQYRTALNGVMAVRMLLTAIRHRHFELFRTAFNGIELYLPVHQGQPFRSINFENSIEKGKNNNLAPECIVASANELFRTASNDNWSAVQQMPAF